jgi:hypothetical protein
MNGLEDIKELIRMNSIQIADNAKQIKEMRVEFNREMKVSREQHGDVEEDE